MKINNPLKKLSTHQKLSTCVLKIYQLQFYIGWQNPFNLIKEETKKAERRPFEKAVTVSLHEKIPKNENLFLLTKNFDVIL